MLFSKNSIEDGQKGAFHGPNAESMGKRNAREEKLTGMKIYEQQFIDGVGHWTQQEAPDTVNKTSKSF